MKAASTNLLLCLLRDLEENLGSTVHVSRDVAYVKQRLKHEGLSFLTISLPSFSKDFFLALERGWIDSDLFIGWKKRKCLPEFLRGFTESVFDTITGRILDEPNLYSIHAVRQVCNLWKKIKLDCTPARIKQAYDGYKRTDDSLREYCPDVADLRSFRIVSRIVVSSFAGREVDVDVLTPHHGPGSTAEGLTGNQKFLVKTWPLRLEPFFTPDILFGSEENYHDSNVELEELTEEKEIPVRVTSVPKTLSTPRIIAMEPVAMQMAQQAVKDYLVKRIQQYGMTAGHVNFRDQSINQKLALRESRQRRLATLDLSEASDRIPNDMVKLLFEVNPALSDLVQRTRSRVARMPDGSEFELFKFASMGSALCFPVESVYFYVLLILAGLKSASLPPSTQNIRMVCKDIYVYGDDLICPVHQVETTVALFSSFGSKVGLSKSFFKSAFRESCGMDAFDGNCITPIYLRNPMPRSQRDASAITSFVATANQFNECGLYRTRDCLKTVVESITGRLPEVEQTCSGLGWHFTTGGNAGRTSARYQRKEVLTLVPSISYKKDCLEGYHALAKCFLKSALRGKGPPDPYSIEVDDEKHLLRSPRRGVVALKRRWVSVR